LGSVATGIRWGISSHLKPEKNKLIVIGGLYRWITAEERRMMGEAAA